jgi:hypothetical protein
VTNSVQETGIVLYSILPWLDTDTSECFHLTGHRNKCQTVYEDELYAYLGGDYVKCMMSCLLTADWQSNCFYKMLYSVFVRRLVTHFVDLFFG